MYKRQEVRNVSKRYRYAYRNLTLKGRVLDRIRGRSDQYIEFDALKDLAFTVPHGQMVVILGRNGAGKARSFDFWRESLNLTPACFG